MGDFKSAFDLGGLPQGDPISPVLWCIIVDMVLTFAEKEGGKGYDLTGETKEVASKLCAYADDLAASDKEKNGIEKSVQAISTILSFFNIRLSPGKCIYMWSPSYHERAPKPPNFMGVRVKSANGMPPGKKAPL
jgi:hypothetical protein